MRNRRTSSPTRGALRLSVFVQNQTQRKGVPLARSFETWIKAALTEHRKGRTEVNIVIVDEVAGRELNFAFRQKNYATNVLSFPYDPLPHEGADSCVRRARNLIDLYLETAYRRDDRQLS